LSQVNLGERSKLFCVYAIGQVRVARDIYPGIMHLLIFWGFTISTIGYLIAATQTDLFIPVLQLPFPRDEFYLAYELVLDLSGLALTLGILMALFRRYVLRPARLDQQLDDLYALLILLAFPVTGYLLEALRLVALQPSWAAWSPIGNWTAQLLTTLGVTEATARAWHAAAWWAHIGVIALFLASLPFTKLSHLITAPFNVVLKPLRPTGALPAIQNLEQAETFGAGKLEEFAPAQLVSFDACTRCGRCQDACPAYLSGLPLSPKNLVQKLHVHMGDAWLRGLETYVIGPVISEAELWACSTCGACLEKCPVFVQPMLQIVEMRRHLSLAQGKVPRTVNETYRNINTQGNPWGLPVADRSQWFEGLGVRVLREGERTDLLYYVGCCFAYDMRNQKVARAMVRLLQTAGVDFAVLGQAENCCGETARRLGEEYLFQTLANQNVETFKRYKFRRVFTQCAHCFNTLKNEYPQFGGDFVVLHYTQILAELLEQGRLKPRPASDGQVVTYQDACYLGRYNGVYAAPRQILKRLGMHLVEMARHGANGFCCGGGGGQMWLETPAELRINQRRLTQALAVKPQVIATACPYCLLMFDDAVKTKGVENQVMLKDIAELVYERVPGLEIKFPAERVAVPEEVELRKAA